MFNQKILTAFAALILLPGCGGGSSSEPTPEPPPASSPPPPEPQSASGMWSSGTTEGSSALGESSKFTNSSDVITCLIDDPDMVCWFVGALPKVFPPPEDGGDPLIQEAGDLLQVWRGQISFVNNVPSGDGDAYANVLHYSCCTLNDGLHSNANTFTIDGGLLKAGESVTIDMTLGDVEHSEGTGVGYRFAAPYNAQYENGRTLEELSGVYGETEIFGRFNGVHHDPCCGFTFDPPLDGMSGFITQGFSVDPDGSFFIQNETCVYSGTIESGGGVNSHRISMLLESSGEGGCVGLEGNYSGLAYVDENGSLVMAVFDDTDRWVAMKVSP